MPNQKMKEPQIIFDSQIFDSQVFGGISRYFCEIIPRMNITFDISVRYSENIYLKESKLCKHRLPVPKWIFNKYKNKLLRKNRKFSEHMLISSSEYLLHATYYEPYFLNWIGNNPYVITVHDMIHEKFPTSFYNVSEIIAHKKEVITHAKRIIAISQNTKEDIIQLLHISPEKIDVIYHSTSMKPFTGKQRLTLPDSFLLFVGDRTPYKNFNRLAKAFSELSTKDENLFLVCTGMPFKQSEKELLDKLNISNKVIHIKATDRTLAELYSRAKLFVFPSLYEGFGIPILEAYACYCPVALSNTSCFPEIAGDAGIYFDPYSETSILESIKEVIYDDRKRTELIMRGRERLKLYSWEKATALTQKTYLKALNME